MIPPIPSLGDAFAFRHARRSLSQQASIDVLDFSFDYFARVLVEPSLSHARLRRADVAEVSESSGSHPTYFV